MRQTKYRRNARLVELRAEGMRTSALARRFHISPCRVKQIVKGVLPPKATIERDQRIQQLDRDGVPRETIAEQLGLSAEHVRHIATQHRYPDAERLLQCPANCVVCYAGAEGATAADLQRCNRELRGLCDEACVLRSEWGHRRTIREAVAVAREYHPGHSGFSNFSRS